MGTVAGAASPLPNRDPVVSQPVGSSVSEREEFEDAEDFTA